MRTLNSCFIHGAYGGEDCPRCPPRTGLIKPDREKLENAAANNRSADAHCQFVGQKHDWLNGTNDPDSKYEYCGRCGRWRWKSSSSGSGDA